MQALASEQNRELGELNRHLRPCPIAFPGETTAAPDQAPGPARAIRRCREIGGVFRLAPGEASGGRRQTGAAPGSRARPARAIRRCREMSGVGRPSTRAAPPIAARRPRCRRSSAVFHLIRYHRDLDFFLSKSLLPGSGIESKKLGGRTKDAVSRPKRCTPPMITRMGTFSSN